MGLYIIGGRTEYFLSNQDGDPTYGNWTAQGELQQIENWLSSLADPNASSNYDLYESWGANPTIADPQNPGGRYPTAKDNVDPWFQLVAVGKTDISGYDQPIWYRTFFVVTSDAERPNALQVVGGEQLFWWDTNQVVSEYAWGQVTSVWVGIGVSGDGLKAASAVGRIFFDQHIGAAGNIVIFKDASFGQPGGIDFPDEAPDVLTKGGDIPISPHQLIVVAKHTPWGWGLSQMRLFVLPANAENPNRLGSYHLGLVGWEERVKDMNEQHDWLITNQWGRSSTEVSHTLGIGQWWTGQWKWGPSIIDLHFAPVTELQWSGWSRCRAVERLWLAMPP